MIIWISGNTGSGKTYLAKKLLTIINAIHLDGDSMRTIWSDLSFSKQDRWTNNIRIANIAKLLESQGYNIIISVIAPYIKLREEIDLICTPIWIYVPSIFTEDNPYELPEPRMKEIDESLLQQQTLSNVNQAEIDRINNLLAAEYASLGGTGTPPTITALNELISPERCSLHD